MEFTRAPGPECGVERGTRRGRPRLRFVPAGSGPALAGAGGGGERWRSSIGCVHDSALLPARVSLVTKV